MMKDIIFLLVCFIIILLVRIFFQKKKIEQLTKEKENIINKVIDIPIDTFDIKAPLEERISFIDAKRIHIHNMDKYFLKSLEEKREDYLKLVNDGEYFYSLFKKGYSISDLYKMEEYNNSVIACFNIANAILGYEINGVYYLTNGRHRCKIAQELNKKVPIYITSRVKSYCIKDLL